jgi:hypothetical protein
MIRVPACQAVELQTILQPTMKVLPVQADLGMATAAIPWAVKTELVMIMDPKAAVVPQAPTIHRMPAAVPEERPVAVIPADMIPRGMTEV